MDYIKMLVLIVIGMCLYHLWAYIRLLETRVQSLLFLLKIYEEAKHTTNDSEYEHYE